MSTLQISSRLSEVDQSTGTNIAAASANNVQVVRTTDLSIIGTQTATTTAANITKTPVTQEGWAVFTNLDDQDYVQIGIDVAATFYPLLRIAPGRTSGPLELEPGVTWQCKSDGTATFRYAMYQRNA